jgi:hypothetical protein
MTVPLVREQCFRLVQTQSGFTNGSDALWEVFERVDPKPDPRVMALFGDPTPGQAVEASVPTGPRTAFNDYTVDWRAADFIHQSDPRSCWAAAVAMVFRQAGTRYDEATFLNAVREVCGPGRKHATVDQIIYAITAVHTDRGVWPSDREGRVAAWKDDRLRDGLGRLAASALGLLTALSALERLQQLQDGTQFAPHYDTLSKAEWTRKQRDGSTFTGGVYPINNPEQLLSAMRLNVPVVVGYRHAKGFHAVVLVGVNAKQLVVGGSGKSLVVSDALSRIETVRIVDPMGQGEIVTMAADQDLKPALFALAVVP